MVRLVTPTTFLNKCVFYFNIELKGIGEIFKDMSYTHVVQLLLIHIANVIKGR